MGMSAYTGRGYEMQKMNVFVWVSGTKTKECTLRDVEIFNSTLEVDILRTFSRVWGVKPEDIRWSIYHSE